MVRHFNLLISLLIISLFTFTSCGLDGSDRKDLDSGLEKIPSEVQSVIDEATELATNLAHQLNGRWADEYALLLASQKGIHYSEFENLKSTLIQLRIETGAYFVYVLTDVDGDDDFAEITIDGSKVSSPWLEQEKIDKQYFQAQEGQVSPSLSAQNNAEGNPVWSVFSPILDSEDKLVGILKLGLEAPIIHDFPAWNRDASN